MSVISKLTYAPLPRWGSIFKAIFSKHSALTDLANHWSVDKNRSFWFSQSAWSLYAIVKFKKSISKKTNITIWLPDYFCNASIVPLRTLGVEIFFYPILGDRRPDLVKCNNAIVDSPPDIIVFVHYFGVSSYPDKLCELAIAKGINTWLVEDAAHCVAPNKNIGKYGDFVIYSPHKILPVPDGGLLLVRENGPNKISNNFLIRHSFYKLYSSMIDNHPVIDAKPYKWLLKRILQKLGVRYSRNLTVFNDDISAIDLKNFHHPKISKLALKMLSIVVLELDKESDRRKDNQYNWYLELQSSNSISVLYHEETCTPYLADCIVKDSICIEDEFNRLQYLGLPVTTWPDLPPEVLKNSVNHKWAIQMRNAHFYLPVHGSISLNKIKFI